MMPDDARSIQVRRISARINDLLVSETEKHGLSTREQIVILSMMFGGVVAMSHIPDDLARALGKQMVDAALEAVAAFQGATQN